MTEETQNAKSRIVAIVGRPNVGKSAIFNRLAGRRIAIVHEQSGVTRDRLMREVEWRGERFELVDTGGIADTRASASRDVIEAGITAQARAALADAPVVIMVADITAGVTPLDEEIAGLLREEGVTVVLAVNKADNADRDGDADEFHRLGVPVFPVSALHDRGFDDLMAPVVEALPEAVNLTVKEPLRVAIVGRPNVGKSSFINRLLRNERVIVSEVAGTTRDSIEVPFTVGRGEQARHYVLIDTAGMRRVGKIDNSVERFGRFRAERSVQDADVCVLIMDGSTGPTTQDKKVASLIDKHRKGCVVVVNKWDLVEEESTQREYGPALQRAMPFLGFCPLVFMSAKSGYNIRRCVDAIDHVAAQVTADLPTGVLNRTIQDAVARVSPQGVGSRHLKIFYAAQVGKEPLKIRIFVNDPKLIKTNYHDYLLKSLRAKFGLEGAPIVLDLVARKRRD